MKAKSIRKRLYWLIRGYNGSKLFFEKTVDLGQFTDRQMAQLLKALAAKAGLDYSEIIGAYATRRTRIANDLLAVHKDATRPTVWCGDSPHFVASVVDKDGKIALFRKLQ